MLTFKELAVRILDEVGQPMTGEEIWKFAESNSYDQLVGSLGKTPWNSMLARIYVSIRDDEDSPFKKVSSRPTKFAINHYSKHKISNDPNNS